VRAGVTGFLYADNFPYYLRSSAFIGGLNKDAGTP
jgi:hypothetical protein